MARLGATILGDIYDAMRAQDLELARNLPPRRFLPCDAHPTLGPSPGRGAQRQKLVNRTLDLILARYEIVRFDTSDLMIRKEPRRGRDPVSVPA